MKKHECINYVVIPEKWNRPIYQECQQCKETTEEK